METDKRRLEILLKRKQKAESLPASELKKWQKQYDAICLEITRIKIKLGLDIWNEHTAVKKLIDATVWISTNLRWYNKDQFLKENSNILKTITDAASKVDEAFNLKSMDTVTEMIEKLKKVCVKVNEAYQIYKDTGFMPVSPDEEAKVSQMNIFGDKR